MLCSIPTIILALLARAVNADFYVSRNGSDASPGSLNQPFATLQRAQTAARGAAAQLTADLIIHVGAGNYYLETPLNLTAADSGRNGWRVRWVAESANGGVNISGGIQIVNWSRQDDQSQIWTASTPIGLESRHFYVDQEHAQRARQSLNRSWVSNVTEGYYVSNSHANFLLSTEGIEHGEIRGINSWTDRYLPIDSVGPNNTLVMAQPSFNNNLVGFDTITNPFVDHGFFVENVLAFLDEPNEYYLNSTTGTIYYMPPTGVDPNQQYLVLPRLEQLLVVSGSYDAPVHDVTFQGFNYMHTTWLLPSSDIGYSDQQTGGFMGLNTTYTEFDFESSRPVWWQVPGSVQVSAAHDVTFTNGSMTAIMGGFGIGNDWNAHTSAVGLGAKGIEISGVFFSQTGGNSITLGGIQAAAHHPNDSRQINEGNLITENTFFDTAKHITDSCSILVTYTKGTVISHNDISFAPYSGICYGYGWGTNDAGGNPNYYYRGPDGGLYRYQPIYQTPTVMRDGVITKNLIYEFGLQHTDLGGIYTLSASPNTSLEGNYIYSGNTNMSGTAIYHDEGSRFYVDSYSVFNVTGNGYGGPPNGVWFQPNESINQTTGNLTAFNIAVADPSPLLTGQNDHGDNVYNITQYGSLSDLDEVFQQIVQEAGVSEA